MYRLLALLTLLVMLTSCTPTPTPIPPGPTPYTAPVTVAPALPVQSALQAAQKGLPFYMVHTNRQHPVVHIMMAGFQQACADLGLLCKDAGVDMEDIPGEIANLERVVANGASGILITVHDKAEYEMTKKAIDAGIPTVNGHFPMEDMVIPGMTAWVAPDNKAYAAAAAKAMAKKLDCKGTVAITQGGLNDGENAVEASFRSTLSAECPNIKILDTQIETFDQPAAIAVASGILQANPDVVGAFSTTGNGPTTWAKGAQDVGKKPGEVTIISMDYSVQNLDLVKNGEVYMLVGQPLYEEMYYAVYVLAAKMMGSPVPYANYLPAPLITKDNIDPYYEINEMAEGLTIQ